MGNCVTRETGIEFLDNSKLKDYDVLNDDIVKMI
jgi:hypothetical protein